MRLIACTFVCLCSVLWSCAQVRSSEADLPALAATRATLPAATTSPSPNVADARVPTTAAAATVPAGFTANFAGAWDSSYGPMTLAQSGNAVTGTYGSAGAVIRGQVSGARLIFTYAEANAMGGGWFELTPDGNSFTGRWRENVANPVWANWDGRRRAERSLNFEGLWKTTYGRMRLHQSGNAVRGVYDFGGGSKLAGTVDDKGVLQFTYEQPDGERGAGSLALVTGAQAFGGAWKVTKSAVAPAGAGGRWTGERVLAVPGRMWLVVLEANWERDLEEEEYSFGLMLRTFFARVPNLKVRHRFFGDEAEFRRWCGEVRYLAEPVVLHISSHGERDGIHIGGRTIDARVIADCLRDGGDLRLLHFGTCLIAGGDIPKQIFAELSPDAPRFPISGYTNVADWGGSAVVDFTYLDLILARGVPPAEALRQTTRMLSFAGGRHRDGDAIAPAGLVMIEPNAPVPATAPAVKP